MPTTTNMPPPVQSYASKTTSGKSSSQHKAKLKTKPTIVISPANDDMPRQAVAGCWRKSVPYREVNYAPISVRPLAKNKLKIEFDNISERDDALKRLQSAKDIRAETGKKLRPMIELKGISKEINKDELIETIESQNDKIRELNASEDDIKLKFTRNNRSDTMLYSESTQAYGRWLPLPPG